MIEDFHKYTSDIKSNIKQWGVDLVAGAIKGVGTTDHYRNLGEALFFEECVAQLKKHSIMLETYSLRDSKQNPEPTYHKLICGLCIKVCPFGKKQKVKSQNK